MNTTLYTNHLGNPDQRTPERCRALQSSAWKKFVAGVVISSIDQLEIAWNEPTPSKNDQKLKPGQS